MVRRKTFYDYVSGTPDEQITNKNSKFQSKIFLYNIQIFF